LKLEAEAFSETWKDVLLVMFSVYIDDSGTAPDQAVAMASALIVPAKRIVALNKEWETFAAKAGFTDFHSSECVCRNPKSEYAHWDDDKVRTVTARVRQTTRKYAVRAFSFAVTKKDYDCLLAPEMKELFGRFHYTWAIQHVLTFCREWAIGTGMSIPFEYVFDWMGPSPAKAEIEDVMALFERSKRGCYTNYSFRKRRDIPALQCTDLLAWSSYQVARHHFFGKSLNPIADENYAGFRKFGDEWLTARSISRQGLSDWVEKSVAPRPDNLRILVEAKQVERKNRGNQKSQRDAHGKED
jgi:hypothetical protein